MPAQRHAWAVGLTVGPCFAWLCWAVQRKRWAHAVAAAGANIALWTVGPVMVAGMVNLF